MSAPRVVIVGSGPAGVSAAWPLVRTGVAVTMLDASDGVAARPAQDEDTTAFRQNPQRWRRRFGDDLGCLDESDDRSPKLSTPTARRLVDDFNTRLRVESDGFTAAGALGAGGASSIWGALTASFEAADFASWPVAASDMQRHYDAVRRRIGVSETLSSPAAQALWRRHRPGRGGVGFRLQRAANAVLDIDAGERQACSRCGQCLFGCARGSIYDSADELPALRRYPNFDYRPGHLVRRITPAGAGHRLHIETGARTTTLSAATVILAAGTIATTGLALARLGWTGRPVRLLSNPAAAAAFVLPSLIGRDLPSRTVSLGQLFYRTGEGAARAAGVLYGADALPPDLVAARMPFSRPFALRLSHALAPALLMATCYLPGEFSDNDITVHDDGRILLRGAQSQAASEQLRAALGRLARAVGPAGAVRVPGSTAMLPPGADAHYAGTLPMGGSGPLATSASGELAGATGLYVADGAALPTLPATHPTLTIMANATRLAEALAPRLSTSAAVSATV